MAQGRESLHGQERVLRCLSSGNRQRLLVYRPCCYTISDENLGQKDFEVFQFIGLLAPKKESIR